MSKTRRSNQTVEPPPVTARSGNCADSDCGANSGSGALAGWRFHDQVIVGQNLKMASIFELIEKVADSDSSIIINGETGTGKGLLARAIHHCSYRRNKPFIQINCGAIPENLLESELFGHMRGAFTGAATTKPGKFELANGGTIFLDEIGDMSPELQVKVLRVLEENEFERVGGCKTIKVDVRVIAATHRNLEQAVEEGQFREDLFYRLYVIPIELPPLRDRKSDIGLLVDHFMGKLAERLPYEIRGISDEALAVMAKYPWPGNVRELKNMVERMVVINQGRLIEDGDLPAKIRQHYSIAKTPVFEMPEEGLSLNSAVSDFEKALIIQSLEKTKWVKNKAAKLLQLKRTTLVEKIKRHELNQASNY